jgi:uncharacterized delta-60 repeat protein
MAAGDLDTTFGFFGVSMAGFAAERAWGNAVALTPRGQVVVAGGAREGGNQAFAVARFRSNGTLDETFGTGSPAPGCALIRWPRYPGFQEARAVVVQPDQRIVVAGHVQGSGGFAVARLDSRGRLDPTFGNSGRVLTRKMRSEEANAIVLQPDGKIVVAGLGRTRDGAFRFGIARYLENGRLDPEFGGDGVVQIVVGGDDFHSSGPVCGALAQDVLWGRLVAAGRTLTEGTGHTVGALIRLQANGSLDPGFGSDGRRLLHGWHALQIVSIAINANGNILAVGNPGHDYDSGFVAWSFDPRDGAFNTFGDAGEVLVSFADLGFPFADPRGVAIHSGATGEGIVIVGTASASGIHHPSSVTYFALARLGLNGRLDSSFGRGGLVVPPHLIGQATAVVVQPQDRKLVVAGTVATGAGQLAVARFLGV